MPASWYAVNLMSNREQQVKKFLEGRDVTCYLPVYLGASKRTDRTLTLERPLFPGYIFVHLEIPGPQKNALLQCPGVAKIIGFGGQPTPIDDQTIESLKILTGAGQGNVNPHPLLRAGQRVVVERGPFKGATGILAAKGTKLVVEVELLGRAVGVPVDPRQVTPLLD